MARSTPQVRTPPMGWNHWNAYSWEVTEDDIRDAADMLVETGMRDAGYEYLVVDDTWMAESLTDDREFEPHPEDFPSGIADLADYVHDKGLKFGIYSSAGTQTCAEYPASLGVEDVHARQFEEWEVDYLKYDNCGDHHGLDARTRYEAMGAELAKLDRDVVYSICEWGDNDPWEWGRNVGGHLWRATGDILAKWESTENDEYGLGIVEIIDLMEEMNVAGYHGPGGFNDPDMLQVGNGPDTVHSQDDSFDVTDPLTEAEEKTHFSFWCLFSAPLMAGNDLRDWDDLTEEILLNEDAIAIDQDPLCVQGTRDGKIGDREVWSKRLAGGESAVILFNRGEEPADVETDVDAVDQPIEADAYEVHDVWTGEEFETEGTLSGTVDPHGVKFYRVSPAE
ncbi:MAG: glycoside hydrolase family 27 protein [Haloarculaceae archaeon]